MSSQSARIQKLKEHIKMLLENQQINNARFDSGQIDEETFRRRSRDTQRASQECAGELGVLRGRGRPHKDGKGKQ